MAPFVKFLEMD